MFPLHDTPAFHDRNAVADAHGLIQIVGNKHDGALLLGLQVQQLILHLCANQRIEGGECLIHQQDVGSLASARASPTRCFHTAREFVRIAFGIGFQPNLIQCRQGAFVARRPWDRRQFQPKAALSMTLMCGSNAKD